MRVESWTIKKANCRRIDTFELWCWRRLLRVPWTARRSTSQSQRKSTLNIHWKDWYWSWSSNTLATWCEELTPWKRSWCWRRLRAVGKGSDWGWNGWMTSSTQWTRVSANSGRWRRRGKPGRLESMESQRVGQDGATEQQWKHPIIHSSSLYLSMCVSMHSFDTCEEHTQDTPSTLSPFVSLLWACLPDCSSAKRMRTVFVLPFPSGHPGRLSCPYN